MEPLQHWLALRLTPGIGARHFNRILKQLGDPGLAFSPSHSSVLQGLLSKRVLAALKLPDWSQVDASLAWAKQPGHHILTLQDDGYPALLKEIADPPPILFAIGDPQFLHHPQLAIVGSRNPTPSGKQTAFDFAHALSQLGLTITSGLALGIDTCCHQGALANNQPTIAVTGTGLDRIYPARNRKLAHQIAEQGLIVSEFPLGTPPLPGNFPLRNRIISGLSLGTLVIEAGLASGSLITARMAAEQGREIFAIPGSIHNPLTRGAHQLIRDGAKLVECTEHILEELTQYGLPPAVTAKDNLQNHHQQDLPAEFQQLLKLIDNDPISVDSLVGQSGLTAETISSMLTTLEIQNVVACAAGRYYRLPEKG